MLKSLSNWNAKRVHQKRQAKIENCALYVVDDFYLALPVMSACTMFPDDPVLRTLSASKPQADAIGATVVRALEYVREKKQPLMVPDFQSMQSDFLEAMERYRLDIGLGKRRFESHMEHLDITREDGKLHLHKTSSVHGRFAFEGSNDPRDQLVIEGAATMDQIGQSVLRLLGKTV